MIGDVHSSSEVQSVSCIVCCLFYWSYITYLWIVSLALPLRVWCVTGRCACVMCMISGNSGTPLKHCCDIATLFLSNCECIYLVPARFEWMHFIWYCHTIGVNAFIWVILNPSMMMRSPSVCSKAELNAVLCQWTMIGCENWMTSDQWDCDITAVLLVIKVLLFLFDLTRSSGSICSQSHKCYWVVHMIC